MKTDTSIRFRSQTLIGRKVVNERSEDLGKVEEFVLDGERGCIEYVVLSFGGVLGVGEKYFAVPWHALRVDQAHNDFILDVDRSVFEEHQGFDSDSWPTEPDMQIFPEGSRVDSYREDRMYPPSTTSEDEERRQE